MSDDELIRRGDAEEAAHEADSLELAQHGARLIAQRIAALPAVTVTDPDDPTLEEIVVVLSGWIDRLIRERVDLRQKLAALDLTPAPDAVVKRVVDLLDNLTERQWIIDGLTVSEIKEIADAIGAVREVQSHKSE